MQIVIVRPHPYMVDRIQAFFQRQGFTVTLAESREALAELAGIQPDAVIISTSATSNHNYALPEALADICQQWPGVPMILTTTVSPEIAQPSLTDIMAIIDPDVRVCLPEEICGPPERGRLAMVLHKSLIEDAVSESALTRSLACLLDEVA